MTSIGKRNTIVDIMKGITIYLVILGHFENIPEVKHWIFSFHMPLFFILAGYYHKPVLSKDTVCKDAKRLLMPYWFVMFVLVLYSFTINIVFRHTPEQLYLTMMGCIFPTGSDNANSVPVWFLFALFWSRFFFNITYKIGTHLSVIFPMILGLLSIWLFQIIPFKIPFALMAGVTALPFFTIGYLWKNSFNKVGGNVIRSVSVVLSLIWLIFYNDCEVGMMSCYYYNYPLAFVCACGGTIGVYYISKAISKIPHLSSLLVWAGFNSLVILCAHTIERYIAIPWNELIELTNTWIVWGIKVTLCSILVLVCSQFRVTRYVLNLKNKS